MAAPLSPGPAHWAPLALAALDHWARRVATRAAVRAAPQAAAVRAAPQAAAVRAAPRQAMALAAPQQVMALAAPHLLAPLPVGARRPRQERRAAALPSLSALVRAMWDAARRPSQPAEHATERRV